jgi:hypothetical protein
MTGCIAASTPLSFVISTEPAAGGGAEKSLIFYSYFFRSAQIFFQKQKFQNNEKIFQKEAIQKKQKKNPRLPKQTRV